MGQRRCSQDRRGAHVSHADPASWVALPPVGRSRQFAVPTPSRQSIRLYLVCIRVHALIPFECTLWGSHECMHQFTRMHVCVHSNARTFSFECIWSVRTSHNRGVGVPRLAVAVRTPSGRRLAADVRSQNERERPWSAIVSGPGRHADRVFTGTLLLVWNSGFLGLGSVHEPARGAQLRPSFWLER